MKFNDSLKGAQRTSGRWSQNSGVDAPSSCPTPGHEDQDPAPGRGSLTHVRCPGEELKTGSDRSPAFTWLAVPWVRKTRSHHASGQRADPGAPAHSAVGKAGFMQHGAKITCFMPGTAPKPRDVSPDGVCGAPTRYQDLTGVQGL